MYKMNGHGQGARQGVVTVYILDSLALLAEEQSVVVL